MRVLTIALVLAIVGLSAAKNSDNNELTDTDPRIKTSEDLVTSVFTECSSLSCVKDKLLSYLDSLLGLSEDTSRSFKGKNIDKLIFHRVGKVLRTNEFKVELPAGAELTYKPSKGLNLDLPSRSDDDESTAEARGILKKKLLLPILLLLKLKLKALMPIFVALIGLKALKALILSKLAIVLVVGFIAYTFLKKGGMPMAMTMTPAEPPMMAYGVPATSPPPSSYEPSWEPSPGGGPYSRQWTSHGDGVQSAQSLAYSAYYPGSSSSSSSNSAYYSSTSSPSA